MKNNFWAEYARLFTSFFFLTDRDFFFACLFLNFQIKRKMRFMSFEDGGFGELKIHTWQTVLIPLKRNQS